ncbi:MAG: sugar ABC transporter ATP-binding protein, partial [bacterium]|nr:sugar ABC transporter ATP-binding protein [bacterium]
IQVQGIGKSFAGVRALQDVDLELRSGEVLAVVGENGAGKSTLMKILAGVQLPDEGQVLIDGQPVKLDSCRAAMERGIVLIHQELNLAENLDVGANIFLGREPLRFGLIDHRKIHEESRKYLSMVGLDVEPTTLVQELSIGRQQMVEIAKALSVGARVLIMDEPTSSLSARETARLFEVVRDLRSKGVSIIYISHRLGEVRELADRACVLRDGRNAGELARNEIHHDNLVRLMVGRELSQFYARTSHPIGEVVLEVRNLVTPAWPQHPVSFRVHQGEIVGLAGLVGAGRSELLQVLFGVDQPLAGEIRLNSETLQLASPADAIAAGIALVPEDRKQHGLILEMSVRENTSLAGLKRNRLPLGFLNRKQEDLDTGRMSDKLRIKTPGPEQVVQYLSGGNQQKVVIGKWLALSPKLLLLDEPTRGIDVGAKEEIYRLMEELAEAGMAILFVSSEMEEILGMSDRTLVMHEGRIAGELQRDELSEESVMQLATGGAAVEALPS